MWIRTQNSKLLNDHYVYTFSIEKCGSGEAALVAQLREGKTETVYRGEIDDCRKAMDLIIYHITVGATLCFDITRK